MSAHVLVAEDNEMQAEVIRRYLEQDGHSVTLVRDGRRALDETRRLQPDLVILEVMMPEVDGLEVRRVLRHESDVLVLSRQQLLDHPNGVERGASERTIDVQVRNLRKQIEADPGRPGKAAPAVSRSVSVLCPAAVRRRERARVITAVGCS